MMMRLLLPLLLASTLSYAQPNLAPNPGFEEPGGWDLIPMAGAEGTMASDTVARSGAKSLKLTKTNAPGYLVLRSHTPVALQPNVRYTCRFRFHAEDASLANVLLLRVAPKDAILGYNSIDRSAGWMSQSLLINSLAGKWEKRVGHYETVQPQEVYLNVLLWGNPCTVRLDDFEFTSEPFKISAPTTEFQNSTTPEALPGLLRARPDSQAQVTVRDGRSTLLLDGKSIPPVLYKAEPYHTEGDYRRFGEAGVKLATVSVRLGSIRGHEGVWIGKDQYNFAPAEAALQKALLRNPGAHVILDLWFYPYPQWGVENPTECWTDHTGTKAYGSWGNLDGFTKDLSALKPGRCEYWWYPSYNSRKWREDSAHAAAALIAHLRQTPYGRAIVGYYLSGGHDGQFQVLGQYDYSETTQKLFRQWLRDKYGTIEHLKHVWGEAPASFDEVQVPAPLEASGNMEAAKPYLTTSPSLDYRDFATSESWRLRDYFSTAVKETAGKPVVTIAYGNPSVYDFWPMFDLKSLDAASSMSYYPFRNAGYALGYHPYDSFALHGKLFFQEIDTRSWAGSVHADEVYQMWIGAGLNPQEWRAINRKLAGVSLAHDHGFWYYDMNHFFDAPEIMAEIGQTAKMAQEPRQRQPSRFRPDVCVIQTPGHDKYLSSEHASLKSSAFYQLMALEQSGVPYDLHYLPDVVARPELQKYRVYVFMQTRYLTDAERAQIKSKLLGGNRTIVWLQDAGYLGEQGKSVEGMSDLLGMKVATEETYARQTPVVTAPALLKAGVQPVLGLNEMLMMIMIPEGQSSFTTREQPFWVEDPAATPLATYHENGRVAAALKKLPKWTSVYLAGANSLTGDLLNYLAREAKAYTCGPAGQSINMSGNFVSLHGLRSGTYPFRLPPGTKQMVAVDTNRPSPVKNGVCNLDITAQETYWYELR